MIGVNFALQGNGEMKFTLFHPVNLAEIDTAIMIYPGCDGSFYTCRNRFKDASNGNLGNYVRLGGFPFSPVGNPSMLMVHNQNTSGGKM